MQWRGMLPATGAGVLPGFTLMGQLDESLFAPLTGTIVLFLTAMQVGRLAWPGTFAEVPRSRVFASTMGLLGSSSS